MNEAEAAQELAECNETYERVVALSRRWSAMGQSQLGDEMAYLAFVPLIRRRKPTVEERDRLAYLMDRCSREIETAANADVSTRGGKAKNKPGPQAKPLTGLTMRVAQKLESHPGIKTRELAAMLEADEYEIADIRASLRARKSREKRARNQGG